MNKFSDKKLVLSIGQAAKMLGVSISTLRRMDKNGIIDSLRNVERGKRYFFKADLLNLKSDGYKLAKEWVKSDNKPNITKFKNFYYPTEAALTGQVTIGLREMLNGFMSDDHISVIISATMELTNNAFYHNQGQWPDVEGVFYAFDRIERKIIIADRGVGLLKNLQLVRKDLNNHIDASRIAFTEQISSRGVAGHRGYGLKYVKICVVQELKRLIFQTGNAHLEIRAKDTKNIYIDQIDHSIQGCLAILEF